MTRKRSCGAANLDARARRLAAALYERLAVRDMAGEVDRTAVELLADALVRMDEARAILRREGMLLRLTTRKGEEGAFPHPALHILRAERAAAITLLRQLGMTPKARGDVRKVGSDGAVDLDELLKLA